jgi:membrane protein implicated in regulation of membrane protease activity
MNLDKMLKTLFGFLLRTVLLLAGLVFLLSLLAAAVLLLAWWGLRALWAKLTGQPVQPLVFTVLRKAQWERFYRGGAGARSPQADDVIDVESRQVDSAGSDRIGR